jgi:hypothetical protein
MGPAFQMIVMSGPMFMGMVRVSMAVLAFVMMMVMRVRVGVRFAIMAMLMSMLVVVSAAVGVFMGQVDVELRPGNCATFSAADVDVIAVEFQLSELALEGAHIQAQVNHRAQEHVAADATENVQVKSFHALAASALIWLAA